MLDLLVIVLCVLFYVSGLLVWPVLLLAWWKKHRRTTISFLVFIAQSACQLVLAGFFVFSHGVLEHPYYWLVIMMMVNILFTPLAVIAALCDFVRDSRVQAS